MSVEEYRLDLGEDLEMSNEKVVIVQDRKTGEFYNPQEAFDTLMNKPEILAVFKRLAVR
jgi:hypothetical protein